MEKLIRLKQDTHKELKLLAVMYGVSFDEVVRLAIKSLKKDKVQ